MRAILIDDEKPALQQLERLLRKDGRFEIAGQFLSARAAIDHLCREKADVVFLDIGMPEMNGLETAEHIRNIDRDIQIVYITAYSEYAVDAFELHALDYVLKPIHPVRFAKTLARLENRVSPASEETGREIEVRCFKRLELVPRDGPGQQLKWRTHKAQELFAYLLHHEGQWVARDRIMDSLWPDHEADKASILLHTSVYQTRKLLKTWGAAATVEFSQEKYRLAAEGLEMDVGRFLRSARTEPVRNEAEWEQVSRVLDLYRGDYLEEHDYPWADFRRKALLQQYTQMSLLAVNYLMRSGRERQAILKLLQLQERDPYSEEILRLLLTAFAGVKDAGGIRQHYERYVRMLREELGVKPDAELDRWARTLPGGRGR